MLKIIPILLLLILSVAAAEVSPTSQNIRSYPLAVKKLYIKTDYSLINNTLDIFSIRNSSAGKASNHGSIGDLSSYNFTLGYGLYPHVSIVYDFAFSIFDYAGENLKNRKHDLFVKLNIYDNPSAYLETFSTDIGLTFNGANNLSITGSNLGISKMSNMSDSSFYMRLLAGSKMSSSILDFYLGIKATSIDTMIDSVKYDRDEIAINAGFEFTIELGSYLVETGYEYIKLFKRDIKNSHNSNHVVNLSLSKILSKQLLIYIGTKYYIHQYNGVIPYLYNEKTKDEFSQRLGYATVGFVYNFNSKL